MPPLVRLTPEIRADLVAYLDGELDDKETERIESVLAQSNVARNDIEGLARTYELLDLLPRYHASAEFAEQTVATIRLSESQPDLRDTLWYRIVRRSLPAFLWMASLVALVCISFLITHRWIRSEADTLVGELPVIEPLDTYTEIGSLEFLELLDRQPAMLAEMTPEPETRESTRD